MLPPRYKEVVIIHLTYVQKKKGQRIFTTLRIAPSPILAAARTWFAETYSYEMNMLPLEVTIKHREWSIVSGDADLFTIDGVRFEQSYIFVGIETTYWYFFKQDPINHKLQGRGVLPCPLCGCCISEQYPIIVESIKQLIEKCKNKH